MHVFTTVAFRLGWSHAHKHINFLSWPSNLATHAIHSRTYVFCTYVCTCMHVFTRTHTCLAFSARRSLSMHMRSRSCSACHHTPFQLSHVYPCIPMHAHTPFSSAMNLFKQLKMPFRQFSPVYTYVQAYILDNCTCISSLSE